MIRLGQQVNKSALRSFGTFSASAKDGSIFSEAQAKV